MSAIRWIMSVLVFLFLLLFALQNASAVPVKFYAWFSWQVPLVFLLLIAFALGAAAGLLAGVTRTVRLKRQLGRLRREHAGQSDDTMTPPLDAA
jgi:lipopolysaccharide assembly protein A